MSWPTLLDAYCGAGGAARGYQQAGFRVIGVDHRPQPRYAGDEFVEADALEYIATHGWGYDAIHASPPCQAYSVGSAAWRALGRQYPDLVAATRTALGETGRSYVIENVPGAPVRPDVILCGCQFPELPGLRRQRWFELSWPLAQLSPPCYHDGPIVTVLSNGSAGPNQQLRPLRGEQWRQMRQRAMGIDWMTRRELGQAVPPPYTRWLGEQLIAHLQTPAPLLPGRATTRRDARLHAVPGPGGRPGHTTQETP